MKSTHTFDGEEVDIVEVGDFTGSEKGTIDRNNYQS